MITILSLTPEGSNLKNIWLHETIVVTLKFYIHCDDMFLVIK